jgi:hypothetical protein
MVAFQWVMSAPEGKALMPGVGLIMRDITSFWRLCCYVSMFVVVCVGSSANRLIKLALVLTLELLALALLPMDVVDAIVGWMVSNLLAIALCS